MTQINRETTLRIVDGLSLQLFELARTQGSSLTQQRMQDEIDAYLQANLPHVVPLSNIQVDYETIVIQLQQHLHRNDAWRDLITPGTGQTIIEMLAQIAAYNQVSIERAAQETMLDTARLSSSIYTASRHLGVHIQRKNPARVRVSLANTTPSVGVIVDLYTPFKVEQAWFFNREPIIFHEGFEESSELFLFEGELIEETFSGAGRPFQRMEVGLNDFSISDEDIYVTVGTEVYKRTIEGLWHHGSQEAVFYENTMSNGAVEVIFGNNIYGKAPPRNSQISIVYARTKGSAGNSTNSNLRVSLPSNSSITGTTTTAVSGGADHKNKEFYRVMSPHIRAAQGRAVTRSDYEAIAMTFPGIADVKFRGQQEIAPNNRSWMNVISATLIKTDGGLLTNTEWTNFVAFMKSKGIYQVEIIRADPVPVQARIKATVFCKTGANLIELKKLLEDQITGRFKVRRFYIGYSYYLSDIYEALEAEGQWQGLVSYVQIEEPGVDIEIGPLEYAVLNSVDLTMAYGRRDYAPRIT